MLNVSWYNDYKADSWDFLQRAGTCAVRYNAKLKPLLEEYKGMIDGAITDIRQLDGLVDQWSQ